MLRIGPVTDWKERLNNGLSELKKVSEEVRKGLENASDEARETWKTQLEPTYRKVEEKVSAAGAKVASNVGEATEEVITAAKERFAEFREKLDGVGEAAADPETDESKN